MGNGPKVSMRSRARLAEISNEGTPLLCSICTLAGCPSLSTSNVMYTRSADVILGSTSYFNQFSATFRDPEPALRPARAERAVRPTHRPPLPERNLVVLFFRRSLCLLGGSRLL